MLIAPGRAERCVSLGMASMLPGKLTMQVWHCDPVMQREVLFSLAPADGRLVNPSKHLTQSQSTTHKPVGTIIYEENLEKQVIVALQSSSDGFSSCWMQNSLSLWTPIKTKPKSSCQTSLENVSKLCWNIQSRTLVYTFSQVSPRASDTTSYNGIATAAGIMLIGIFDQDWLALDFLHIIIISNIHLLHRYYTTATQQTGGLHKQVRAQCEDRIQRCQFYHHYLSSN